MARTETLETTDNLLILTDNIPTEYALACTPKERAEALDALMLDGEMEAARSLVVWWCNADHTDLEDMRSRLDAARDLIYEGRAEAARHLAVFWRDAIAFDYAAGHTLMG